MSSQLIPQDPQTEELLQLFSEAREKQNLNQMLTHLVKNNDFSQLLGIKREISVLDPNDFNDYNTEYQAFLDALNRGLIACLAAAELKDDRTILLNELGLDELTQLHAQIPADNDKLRERMALEIDAAETIFAASKDITACQKLINDNLTETNLSATAQDDVKKINKISKVLFESEMPRLEKMQQVDNIIEQSTPTNQDASSQNTGLGKFINKILTSLRNLFKGFNERKLNKKVNQVELNFESTDKGNSDEQDEQEEQNDENKPRNF